ncbi:uncharacterized protein LOC121381977 isoform X2 [Gigantopelta aegis]|uniref:uncharacterized protein LOC121381977 isoform X2 n=1 Tax=Gigantopelta aegis TaxID=1735272 RepID=UPI001B88C77F|nr:uncharacterized protein LOC121381977 isoform X2 [Gigantopelta aegis]
MAACKWARSWSVRGSGLDVGTDAVDPAEDADVPTVLYDLDVNGDGVVELNEIAHVTGLKVTNPVLIKRFHAADSDVAEAMKEDSADNLMTR